MRKPIRVELSEEEAASLKMWLAAGKTEQRLAKRAQVILCVASGMSLKAMATKTGLAWQSCLKWRKRFVQNRLEGLKDQKRSSHPLVITPEERVRVMAPDRDARRELTQRIVSTFEPLILKHLDQWYHFIPIWRKTPPKFSAAKPRPVQGYGGSAGRLKFSWRRPIVKWSNLLQPSQALAT